MAIVHATGDLGLLARLEVGAAGGTLKRVPDALVAELRATASSLGRGARPGAGAEPAVDRATLARMVRLASGYDPDDDHVDMLIEQAALPFKDEPGRPAPLPADRAGRFKVVVVGAGASGLLAGIELDRAGIPFVVVEKNEAVGGTWHENAYPGCGVDTPSFFYSYSFAQDRGWSRYFAKRDEIARYFEALTDAHGLRSRIRFGTEVVSARYDEARAVWRLAVRGPDGRAEMLEANAVVTAVGQLNRPAIPAFEGRERFRGPVVHTARWPASVDLRGRRVVMVGTGASGMQVGPAIAPGVAKLTVLQRSPHWILPNPLYNREIGREHRELLDHVPFYAGWLRLLMIWSYGDAVFPALTAEPGWATPETSLNAVSERYRRSMIRHVERELAGRPDLVGKSIPAYPPYGKRVLLDNGWFEMLRRGNVELAAAGVAEIREDGVAATDGSFHPADAIVLATGFQASRMLWPMEIEGRGGVRLRDLWGDDDPRAHLGITVPGFPNLFVLYGPNTNLGYGGSAIFHSECQTRYVVKCLRAVVENGWRSLECRQDVHDDYNRAVDDRHARMVWAHPGVTNWYKNARGRVTTNSPWRLLDYWKLTAAPRFDDFRIDSGPGRARTDRADAAAGG